MRDSRKIKYDAPITLKSGYATPAPPIGTILGPTGIDIYKFCDDFNKWAKNFPGITEFGVIVYDDLSYQILTKEKYRQFKASQFAEAFSFQYHSYEDEKFGHNVK